MESVVDFSEKDRQFAIDAFVKFINMSCGSSADRERWSYKGGFEQ